MSSDYHSDWSKFYYKRQQLSGGSNSLVPNFFNKLSLPPLDSLDQRHWIKNEKHYFDIFYSCFLPHHRVSCVNSIFLVLLSFTFFKFCFLSISMITEATSSWFIYFLFDYCVWAGILWRFQLFKMLFHLQSSQFPYLNLLSVCLSWLHHVMQSSINPL